jgi:hypothetical protein
VNETNKIAKLDQIMKLLKATRKQEREYNGAVKNNGLDPGLFEYDDGAHLECYDVWDRLRRVSFTETIDYLLKELEEEKKKYLVVEEI